MEHATTSRTESSLTGYAQPAGRVASAASGMRQRRPVVVRPQRRSKLPLLLIALTALLAGAWLVSDRNLINPEHGAGYWIGIAAAVMLLMVLLYPLRKRSAWLAWLGRVGGWFRLHMALGLIAPALVLIHSNFSLGALNSNVALVSLLVVAVSGLVGRYLYGRIHLGLYGARASVPDLQAEALRARHALGHGLMPVAGTWDTLEAFERRALVLPRSMPARLWHAFATRRRSRRLRRHLIGESNRAIDYVSHRQGWSRRQSRERRRLVAGHLDAYFDAVDRGSSLAIYDRLFALWHVLHVPLFVVLILAVILHIVAVHLY